jgi:hypothetical protein
VNYSSLTKTQLIARIEELEQKTLEAKVALVKKEVVLAWEDLTRVVRWFYESGVQTRKAIQSDQLLQGVLSSVRTVKGSSTAFLG